MCCNCNILLKCTMPQCFWKYMKLVFIQATVRFMSSVERSRLEARDGKKWTHFERERLAHDCFLNILARQESAVCRSLYISDIIHLQ